MSITLCSIVYYRHRKERGSPTVIKTVLKNKRNNSLLEQEVNQKISRVLILATIRILQDLKCLRRSRFEPMTRNWQIKLYLYKLKLEMGFFMILETKI